MAGDSSRTYHANQAMQLSELIALKFSPQRFGKTPPRIVRVSEPDGPSTDGGRKARQPMLLVSEKGDPSSNIVFGFLDVVKRSAELRSYALLKQQYEARHHGGAFDISDEEYGRLLGTMRDFLATQEVSFELVETQARPTSRSDHKPLERASSTPRPRGSSGISAPPATQRSDWPPVPMAIGFAAGLIAGFVLCYLLLKAT